MSVIRFSADRSRLYAPTESGEFFGDLYLKRQRRGELADIAPDAPLITPRSSSARHRDFLAHYVAHSIDTQMGKLKAHQPIIVMIHGFLFDPYHTVNIHPWHAHNPHRRLFHFEDFARQHRLEHKAVPWPKDMHLRPDDEGENGVALAFGWFSKPGLASSLKKSFVNHYVQAYDYATQTAELLIRTLAEFDRQLTEKGVKNPFDILTHSLGSRVTMRAIHELSDIARIAEDVKERNAARALLKRLGRIVILGGAEYVVDAQRAYRALRTCEEPLGSESFEDEFSPRFLGRDEGPQFYNVCTRENDVLDLLGENFGPRTFGNTNVIGHDGLGGEGRLNSRWRDIFLDHRKTKEWLRTKRDITVLSENDAFWAVWDHWFYYTAPENNALYRGIYRDRDRFSLKTLTAEKMPHRP
ncbi:MAG: hypothetical protein AAF196_14295 [Planctomycetota bacterium]